MFESKSLANIHQVAFKFLKNNHWRNFVSYFCQENKDGRHQGNHHHNLLYKKYKFLEEMKYCILFNSFLSFLVLLRIIEFGQDFTVVSLQWYIN